MNLTLYPVLRLFSLFCLVSCFYIQDQTCLAADSFGCLSLNNKAVSLNTISEELYQYQIVWEQLSSYYYFRRLLDRYAKEYGHGNWNCLTGLDKKYFNLLGLNTKRGEFQDLSSYKKQFDINNKLVNDAIMENEVKINNIIGKTFWLYPDDIDIKRYNMDTKSFSKIVLQFYTSNGVIIRSNFGESNSCGKKNKCKRNMPRTTTYRFNSLYNDNFVINGQLHDDHVGVNGFRLSNQKKGFSVLIRNFPVDPLVARNWRAKKSAPKFKVQFKVVSLSDTSLRYCHGGGLSSGVPYFVVIPMQLVNSNPSI